MQLSVAVDDVWKLLEPLVSLALVSVYQVTTSHRSLIPGIWALSQFLSIKLQWSLLYCYCISSGLSFVLPKCKLTYTSLSEQRFDEDNRDLSFVTEHRGRVRTAHMFFWVGEVTESGC